MVAAQRSTTWQGNADFYGSCFFPRGTERVHLRGRLRHRFSQKKTFVDKFHWIENDEMLDLVAIAETAPGSIAISGAIVVGYKLAGLLGMLITVVATTIPPLVIISLIALGYRAVGDNELVKRCFWACRPAWEP